MKYLWLSGILFCLAPMAIGCGDDSSTGGEQSDEVQTDTGEDMGQSTEATDETEATEETEVEPTEETEVEPTEETEVEPTEETEVEETDVVETEETDVEETEDTDAGSVEETEGGGTEETDVEETEETDVKETDVADAAVTDPDAGIAPEDEDAGPPPPVDCVIDADCTDSDACSVGSCLEGKCSYEPVERGAPCGSDSDTECTRPDVCNGAGRCLRRNLVAGTPCGDRTNTDCDGMDTCNGLGECVDNIAAEGASCGDDSDNGICDRPDTCNGLGACLENIAELDTPCGGAEEVVTTCDGADTCDGEGVCLDNYTLEGVSCGDTMNYGVCDGPDSCDGEGSCSPNFASAETRCGTEESKEEPECDPWDLCDGLGTCEALVADDGDSCGDSTDYGECDAPDTCLSGACESNIADEGASCGDDTDYGICDAPDTCDGIGGEGSCQQNWADDETECEGEGVCEEGECVGSTCDVYEPAEDDLTFSRSTTFNVPFSFSGATNDFDLSCGCETAPDYIFTFVAPITSWYLFATLNPRVIGLLDGTCGGEEVACQEGEGVTALVYRQLDAGEAVTVVVENPSNCSTPDTDNIAYVAYANLD